MTTNPKPFVFVLMPFSAEFDDLYQLGIKPACEQAGAYAERVDEQLFQGGILDRIYNQINKADVVIAEMTGLNANVFYETGYAHALGKTVILMTKDVRDIPFDLRHYPHLVHEGAISALIPKLAKTIRWALENPQTSAAPPLAQLGFFLGGVDLAGGPRHILRDVAATSGFLIQLDMHNSIEKRIREVRFQLAVLSDERLHSIYDNSLSTDPSQVLNRVRTPEGRYIHVLRRPIEILPGSWESVKLWMNVEPRLQNGEGVDIGVRVFCEGLIADYALRVEYHEPESK